MGKLATMLDEVDAPCSALRLSQILPRMRPRMNHPLGIRPSPQPDFAWGGYGTRLSNKINAAGSTNPLIWTALTLSRPFGTQFVSRVLTQGFKALHILKRSDRDS
jgi:hypothetical protein